MLGTLTNLSLGGLLNKSSHLSVRPSVTLQLHWSEWQWYNAVIPVMWCRGTPQGTGWLSGVVQRCRRSPVQINSREVLYIDERPAVCHLLLGGISRSFCHWRGGCPHSHNRRPQSTFDSVTSHRRDYRLSYKHLNVMNALISLHTLRQGEMSRLPRHEQT